MENLNVYQLLVEGRISDNIRKTKKLFNSVLEGTKEDKDLFENQFMVINENHNIDCSDIKKGFKSISTQLKEAKKLIEEAEKEKKKSNLKKAQNIIRKAHKSLRETETMRDDNIDSFHSVVNIAEGLERKASVD